MRGISGLLFLAIAGHALYHGDSAGWSMLSWTAVVLAIVCGGFQIFEALSGWCVMRALGFRTPL